MDQDQPETSGAYDWANHVVAYLDEPTWRREGWTSHRSAQFADGQVWHFPRVGLAEAIVDPGIFEPFRSLAPPETSDPQDPRFWHHQLKLDAVYRGLAGRLLAINYHLDACQIRSLTSAPMPDQFELNWAVHTCLFEWDSVAPPKWGTVLYAVHVGCIFLN